MDTELARTFLAVATGGSFIAAADRLHVTQSTVSARIRTLEGQLGAPLFVRNKAGATMTAAGRRFQKHAASLVRAVEQARHDVGLPAGYRDRVVVAARIGLWEGFLLDWLAVVCREMPDVAIRAEIGFEADLMQGLIEGRIDIGVMYTPQRRANLEVLHLMDERLVLVASPAAAGEPRTDYIHVDWGPEFYAQYDVTYPDLSAPGLSVNIGWLGLQHLLAEGGSGYFPDRLVRPLVAEGRLNRVANAPEFPLPAYLVHARGRDDAVFTGMRDRLAALAERAERPG